MPERRDFLVGLAAMLAVDEDAAAQDTIYISERQAERDRPFVLDFIEEFAFVMLITSKGGLRVTNVSTSFNRDKDGWGSIWWHIAKSNKQNNVSDGQEECLVVFNGPYAYISPNWYNTKSAVPTSTFAAVHVKVKLKRIDDDAAYEGNDGGGENWDYSKLPDNYLKGMRQGIVAYEMKIEAVEGKFKRPRSQRSRP